MNELPPDLSRLGRELTTAADQSLRRRRLRRRLVHRAVTVGGAGALVFLALTPSGLGPSTRVVDATALGPLPLTAQVAVGPTGQACDRPHGNPETGACVRNAIHTRGVRSAPAQNRDFNPVTR